MQPANQTRQHVTIWTRPLPCAITDVVDELEHDADVYTIISCECRYAQHLEFLCWRHFQEMRDKWQWTCPGCEVRYRITEPSVLTSDLLG